VDCDGHPVDALVWVRANAVMVAFACGIAVVGYVDSPSHRAVRAGIWLGAALTLGTFTVSRLWTLIHDRWHRDASREWWIAHQLATRRLVSRGGWIALAGLAGLLAMAVSTKAWFTAAVLVGPILGALLVLAFVGESWRRRRRLRLSDSRRVARG
jgi:hypothetical protein